MAQVACVLMPSRADADLAAVAPSGAGPLRQRKPSIYVPPSGRCEAGIPPRARTWRTGNLSDGAHVTAPPSLPLAPCCSGRENDLPAAEEDEYQEEDEYKEEEEYVELEPSRAPAARSEKDVPKPARGSQSGSGGSGTGTQAATATATATQPPPAQKKRMPAMRDAAAADEEVEGKKVPATTASGRAPAAVEDDSLKPRSLYECIELASEGSEHVSTILNISVDGWIEVYKSNAASGLVAWANVVVRAGGIKIVHPIEERLTEEKREMLVTTASDNGGYVEPNPLSDKKLTKAFKRGLRKLMETLLEKVKHKILFDGVLMPWLLEWLTICSQVHASAEHGAQHGTQPLCACRN